MGSAFRAASFSAPWEETQQSHNAEATFLVVFYTVSSTKGVLDRLDSASVPGRGENIVTLPESHLLTHHKVHLGQEGSSVGDVNGPAIANKKPSHYHLYGIKVYKSFCLFFLPFWTSIYNTFSSSIGIPRPPHPPDISPYYPLSPGTVGQIPHPLGWLVPQ